MQMLICIDGVKKKKERERKRKKKKKAHSFFFAVVILWRKSLSLSLSLTCRLYQVEGSCVKWENGEKKGEREKRQEY